MIGSLEDMIETMKSGVWDFTKDGECSNCGQCCADALPVTEAEIKKIRRYIAKNRIKEQKHFIPARNPNVIDMTCPFRDNGNRRCVIYDVRPMICREFRCDKPSKGEWIGPEEYEKDHQIVSMRRIFFGGKR